MNSFWLLSCLFLSTSSWIFTLPSLLPNHMDASWSHHIQTAKCRQGIFLQPVISKSYLLQSLLFETTHTEVVSACSSLFGQLIIYGKLRLSHSVLACCSLASLDSSAGQFRHLMLQTVLSAFTSLYSDTPIKRVCGLTIISVLSQYGNCQSW